MKVQLNTGHQITVCVCVEVGSTHTARRRVLSDSLAAAVSLAELPGSSRVLQLLRSHLLDHCRRRELRRLLLQRPRYQPATAGPHQMVHTASRLRTHLLQ